jgi:hypothetical protein
VASGRIDTIDSPEPGRALGEREEKNEAQGLCVEDIETMNGEIGDRPLSRLTGFSLVLGPVPLLSVTAREGLMIDTSLMVRTIETVPWGEEKRYVRRTGSPRHSADLNAVEVRRSVFGDGGLGLRFGITHFNGDVGEARQP